jgi:uncharacterized protein
MKPAIALFGGLLFGGGLYVSMMANPEKVLAFLDIAGAWDPSLLLVMVAAVAVAAIGFAVSRHRQHAIDGSEFAWPTANQLDTRLIGGAALFGIGWGLTGYCPGPGFAALVVNPIEAIPYLAAMIAGMLTWQLAGSSTASARA